MPMFGVSSERGTAANHRANDDRLVRRPPLSGCSALHVTVWITAADAQLLVRRYITQVSLLRVSYSFHSKTALELSGDR